VFKVCKNLSSLLDTLQLLQETLRKIKDEHISECPQLKLLNLHFYIVLDNVKSLLKIERQKKVIEKLAITQSLVNSPTLFSICVINDSLTDEI